MTSAWIGWVLLCTDLQDYIQIIDFRTNDPNKAIAEKVPGI